MEAPEPSVAFLEGQYTIRYGSILSRILLVMLYRDARMLSLGRFIWFKKPIIQIQAVSESALKESGASKYLEICPNLTLKEHYIQTAHRRGDGGPTLPSCLASCATKSNFRLIILAQYLHWNCGKELWLFSCLFMLLRVYVLWSHPGWEHFTISWPWFSTMCFYRNKGKKLSNEISLCTRDCALKSIWNRIFWKVPTRYTCNWFKVT